MNNFLHHQLTLFRLAMSFLTRLPTGTFSEFRPEEMHSAMRYFPLVGWLLATLLALIYSVASAYVGSSVAIVLLMIASLLMTGAMHEDGLADCFDGFYGGFTQERKREIMKDSRLGTYASSALMMTLLCKFVLLQALAEQQQLLLALCIAYPLSRGLAISHSQHLSYISGSNSKSEPLAKPLTPTMLWVIAITGSAAILALPFFTIVTLLLSVMISRWLLKRWMFKHLGGYTGDCLGAAQQFQELTIYMVLLSCAG